jgi:hypothetical protein
MAHAAKQQEGLQGLVWVMLFPLPGRERGRVRVDEPALSPREAGARDVLEPPNIRKNQQRFAIAEECRRKPWPNETRTWLR